MADPERVAAIEMPIRSAVLLARRIGGERIFFVRQLFTVANIANGETTGRY